MKLYLIVPFIIFINSAGNSQNNSGTAQSPTIEQLMQEKIRLLKNGALLVRLQTKENSIMALRDAGNQDLADQVELKQTTLNKELIKAFRENYNFSEVYFFQSQYSEPLLKDRIEEVVFVNDDLNPDPAIKCTKKDYLTAEINVLDPDTAAYFESYYFGYGGVKKSYSGGPDMGFEALKIMNKHFVQLKDPFPYYVRTYDAELNTGKLDKIVAKMNKKLVEFYEKNKEK